MKKTYRIICLILCSLLVVAFTACARDDKGNGAPKDLTDFTVVVPHTIESMDEMCLYLGMALGYFEEEGLNLKIISGDNPTDVQMVATGQADIAVPSPSVLMTQIQAGLDLVLVGNYQPINIFGFAAPVDSPIAGWDDITQETTILLGNPAWEAIAYPSLHAIGLDPFNMTYIVGGEARYTMAQEGQADLLLTWVSEYYQILGMGYDFKFFVAHDVLPAIANGWVVTRESLDDENQRDLIAAFMRATAKSVYAQYADPNAAADAVLAYFPGLDITWEGAMDFGKGRVFHQFGMDAEYAEYFTYEAGIMYIHLEDIEITLDYMREVGILEEGDTLVAEELFTNDFVPEPFTKEITDQIREDLANYEFNSRVYLEWKESQGD